MDEIRRARIRAAAQALMAAHDGLVDLLPAGRKKLAEEDALVGDAMDSLEECIDSLLELLEEEG